MINYNITIESIETITIETCWLIFYTGVSCIRMQDYKRLFIVMLVSLGMPHWPSCCAIPKIHYKHYSWLKTYLSTLKFAKSLLTHHLKYFTCKIYAVRKYWFFSEILRDMTLKATSNERNKQWFREKKITKKFTRNYSES